MHIRNHFLSALIIFLLLMIGGGVVVSSVASNGTNWKNPISITDRPQQFIHYHSFQKTGDVSYYRFQVSQPTTARFEISLPRSANAKFAPQLVIFEPSSATIGPILPIEQPPLTIAQVYPVTQPRQAMNAFTQTLSTVRLEAQPEFTVAGTYLFAVYNAGSAAGNFKLVVDHGSSLAQWQDAWLMPVRWWQDQAFAGLSLLTLITPVLIGLALWFVYLRLDHHQLHVHKTYPTRTRKKSS